MTPGQKMEVTFTSIASTLILHLFTISSHAAAINSPEKLEFFNITTLNTYSLSSPDERTVGAANAPLAQGVAAGGDGGLKPGGGGGGVEAKAGAADSSAEATDQEGRSFPKSHETRHPANILGKPSGEGHWATPPPHSSIVLPFVPFKLFSQVRHTYEVNRKPRSDAIASASTPEELAAAARLRESIQTKKISEVYSEEGYEDSAYDHAGFKKDAGFSEGQEGHEGGRRKSGNGGGGGGHEGGLSEAATTSEDQKYPFHKIPSSAAVPIHSPLRYALNPASGEIPSKSSGGTEFYDSTDDVECPTVVQLPPIPGRGFRRPAEADEDEGDKEEKGEETREPKLAPTPPPPPTPRLKGLGDKIDCLRTKYFGGEEPLDNPFFKEQVVNVAKNEIKKAKEEESRIKQQIEADKSKGRDGKNAGESEVQETRVPVPKREKSYKGYASGFESYNPPKNSRTGGKVNSSAPAVVESVGEDRMGEETEDSAAGSVGAAVEGLPSGTASDSDMEGFYADIMGHIRSATGNIVRQAYSGRNGAASDGRVRRVRPPKAPRPPIIGFVDERQPFPASEYPSVLPAPSNYEDSDNRHSIAVEGEEGEEYAGSEVDEEEEDEGDEGGNSPGHHHHHSHPNFLGGAQRVILRPIQPQSQRHPSGGGSTIGTDAPFRPSPLLYVQTHPAAQRIVMPTHAVHHASGESYMHHHHHHHPHSGESHTHHHHSPSGLRTFLVPTSKRPVPLSPPPIGHHYHVNTVNGVRGTGTLLVPTTTRYISTTPIYPSFNLYSSRSPYNSLKRQSPVGQQFDGLLTATTQTVTTLAMPPSNFRRYRAQQPIVDMVASSSSVSNSFTPPRNIEYFTLKDSLPHTNKKSLIPSKLLPPESETLIPQITFTTTEKYANNEHLTPEQNVAPIPPVGTNTDYTAIAEDGDSETVESATQEYPHDRTNSTKIDISTDRAQTSERMSTVTSDSSLKATVLGTPATKLVTEEVAKGIVKTAIEEGAKKRRKNLRDTKTSDSSTVDVTDMSTERPRFRRRRKNRIGSRNLNEEREVVPEGTSINRQVRRRIEKKSQEQDTLEDTPKVAPRIVSSRGDRSRRGERGTSRTRIGMREINNRNQGSRGNRGLKRGEPSYETQSNEDPDGKAKITDDSGILHGNNNEKSERTKRSTTDAQQRTERQARIIPKETTVAHDSFQQTGTRKGSSTPLRGATRDQSNLHVDRIQKEGQASPVVYTENLQSQGAPEEIEEPRKIFIEPRIRGDRRRVQIPRKIITRSRSQHRIRVTTNPNDGSKSTEASSPETERNKPETDSSDSAVRRWEAGKRRILTSLEGMGEERSRGNQRESQNFSQSRSNPNNQRVLQHREVKETLTSVYTPKE